MDGPISSPAVGVKLPGTPMTLLRVSLSHRLGAITLTIDRDLMTLPLEMPTNASFEFCELPKKTPMRNLRSIFERIRFGT